MCALKSCGMSAVCTWGVRGFFFLTLVLFGSSPTVLCAALWQDSFLRMYRTISKTPNFLCEVPWTACVCDTSDHLPSHYFPARKRKKKFWFPYHNSTLKNRSKKNVTKHNSIHVICQRCKLFLFCIWIHMTYEFIWHMNSYDIWIHMTYEFISFESHVKW